MIILIYTGILLLSYGIYNTICYLFVLSTAGTGRNTSEIGNKRRILFIETAAVLISKELVRKWDLKWNYTDAFEELLKAKRIYIEGTIYLISRFILLFSGALWALPMLFINKMIFWSMILLSLLWGVAEALKLIPSKRSSEKKYKRKMINITCKLLPGAFFIAQLMLFIWLFT